jgi:hypothetical protein
MEPIYDQQDADNYYLFTERRALQWTLDNIYTIARREVRRLERAGAAEIESVSGDRWGHVLRLCESAGCQGCGVLRDNGGSVAGASSPPETEEK